VIFLAPAEGHGLSVEAASVSDPLPVAASEWLFQPLVAGDHALGVLGLSDASAGDPVRPDQLPLLANLVDQAALVLERFRLESEMRDVDVIRTRDKLRGALLSSVSHDLRTPLTSVMAAAAALDHGATPELIATIKSEAARLNRFVANLLDMARVEAGALKLNVEAIDLSDAVTSAAHDARGALQGHELRLQVPPDLPLVRADPQLLHHCLLNLLDNAGRYGDPGTPIVIEGTHRFGTIRLAVLDQGPGLPPGREQEVFETFRRFEGSDRAVGGTGLGLAIVKAFAEAMGITVEAANHEDGGARFGLTFPSNLVVRATAPENI
jgi:two-component system sensor histidine kinase KdpD